MPEMAAATARGALLIGRQIGSAVGLAVCLASAVCAQPEPQHDEPLRPLRFGLSLNPTSQFYDILIEDCILTVVNYREFVCPAGQADIDTQKIDLRHVEFMRLIPSRNRERLFLTVEPSSDAPPFDPELSALAVYRDRRDCDGRPSPEVSSTTLDMVVQDDWATHDFVEALRAIWAACDSVPNPLGSRP